MEENQKDLQIIAELSREFGIERYVRGGGGNTSVKNDKTLWVKPSGKMLSDLQESDFLAMDREKLSELYDVEPPKDSSDREALIKNQMAKAVLPETPGRASVEAPLHDSLSAKFVVHTHPALVNGLTCSQQAREKCAELFPEALWIDYIDPGYTLCMHVREKTQEYEKEKKRQPELIVLQNHGIFVAADTAEQIRGLYSQVMDTLSAAYEAADVSMELDVASTPTSDSVDEINRQLREILPADEASAWCVNGPFPVATGPLTPDHIVYHKSYPYEDPWTRKGVDEYRAEYGYSPQILVNEQCVVAVGTSDRKAVLAMEMAQDGALVAQLAEAFGGVHFMEEESRLFIENWEVEAYRSGQIK